MKSKSKSETYRAKVHRLEKGELILIRAGQHIFRLWRAGGRIDGNLDRTLDTIWALKAQIRAEKRSLRPQSAPNYRKPKRASRAA